MLSLQTLIGLLAIFLIGLPSRIAKRLPIFTLNRPARLFILLELLHLALVDLEVGAGLVAGGKALGGEGVGRVLSSVVEGIALVLDDLFLEGLLGH